MEQVTERTYTLAEARQVLAVRECNTHGHEWDVVAQNWARMPVLIRCDRCGWTGDVTMRNESPSESRT